jgi:hypothetical protein
VVIATTPKVQYAYSFTTGGTMNHSRLTTLTYPNGRALAYNYAADVTVNPGSGVNDSISRLTKIVDGATSLENYDYRKICLR